MRPTIERITNDLIDAMMEGPKPVDLVESLAFPLPSLVICELMGVPYDRHTWFRNEYRTALASDSTQEQVGGALITVMQYLAQLTRDKLTDPGDDLISLLINHVHSGDLSVEEVSGMATMLLMAGHETTGNMIALGTYTLLEHPDQLDALRADRRLLPGAVEELIRYHDVVGNLPRVMTEEVHVGECTFAKGDIVMLAMDQANRDDAAFELPNAFDIRRNSRGHLAFGHGTHACIGAPLARIQLQVALGAVIERLPNLELAVPVDDLEIKNDAKVFGFKSLPVSW